MFILHIHSRFYTLFSCHFIRIFFLLSSYAYTSHSSYRTSALCFLTQRPSPETLLFASQLAQNIPFIDVFIVIDDHTYTNLSTTSPTVQFLYINETLSINYGFREANVAGVAKSCSAWDKALFYFSKQTTHHSFVWFIEEDVFIPSFQAFRSLHELYSSFYDLVTPQIEYDRNGRWTDWPHWPLASGRFFPLWAKSMVCAIGCSRRLLSVVNEYAQWHGRLAFIEFFFHTLAIQDSQMKVVTPLELSTIVWRQDYAFKEIQAKPSNWWHPVKNFAQQELWRNGLINTSTSDNSSILIPFHSIEKQLVNMDVTNLTSNIESEMKNVLVRFELVKGQMDSTHRRQLRDRFLRQATNQSKDVASLCLLLADHAFKLSQPNGDKIMKINKTSHHRRLEKAIEKNKQMVLSLMKNDHPRADNMVTVSWLRDEAERLIRELTSEIQCEEQMNICNRTREWFELDYEISQDFQRNLIHQFWVPIIVVLCMILVFYKTKKEYCFLRCSRRFRV